MENNSESSETCKRQRDRIHKLVDPLWQNGFISRAAIYKRLGEAVGNPNFHMRNLVDERVGEKALSEATKIYTDVMNKHFRENKR